jgi:hypothetical protein
MPPSPKPPAPNGPGTYSSGGPARQTYGSGNALSSEQVAQILYQVGFRGDDLAFFVGIGKRESGNQPGVHGTTADPSKMSGDIGLFQINSVNDTPAAQAAVGYTDRSQWTDPVINAKMVFYMSHGGANKAPWSGSAGGFAANGDPYYHVGSHGRRQRWHPRAPRDDVRRFQHIRAGLRFWRLHRHRERQYVRRTGHTQHAGNPPS